MGMPAFEALRSIVDWYKDAPSRSMAALYDHAVNVIAPRLNASIGISIANNDVEHSCEHIVLPNDGTSLCKSMSSLEVIGFAMDVGNAHRVRIVPVQDVCLLRLIWDCREHKQDYSLSEATDVAATQILSELYDVHQDIDVDIDEFTPMAVAYKHVINTAFSIGANVAVTAAFANISSNTYVLGGPGECTSLSYTDAMLIAHYPDYRSTDECELLIIRQDDIEKVEIRW